MKTSTNIYHRIIIVDWSTTHICLSKVLRYLNDVFPIISCSESDVKVLQVVDSAHTGNSFHFVKIHAHVTKCWDSCCCYHIVDHIISLIIIRQSVYVYVIIHIVSCTFYIMFEFFLQFIEKINSPSRNNLVAFLCPLNTLSAEKLLRTKTQELSLVHVI